MKTDGGRIARQEAQARDHALPAARPAATTRSPFAARPIDDALAPAGRKLPDALRARMETRFARDFSMVRVHNDAAGHRAAQDAAARALAYGNDIAFAPGAYAPDRAEGQNLIAHELSHVAQQQQAGAPEVARDGPVGTGLGSAPPKDDFITMTTQGSEDSHALFAINQAAPPDADALLKPLGEIKGPVTVHLHGYASAEGDATWNLNLSAHRAIAAKKVLQDKLPPGSRIVAFAHGATADFGKDREANRRVGVSLIGPVDPGGFKLKGSLFPPPSAPWQPVPDVTKLPVLPQFGVGLPNIDGPAKPDPLGLVVPPVPLRRDLMDLSALTKGMAAHGIAPGQYGDLLAFRDRAFLKYKSWGLSDETAAALADSEVSGTVSSQAERDNPNAIDRSNADWKAAHPDAFETPFLKSPNLFDIPSWFSKKKKP